MNAHERPAAWRLLLALALLAVVPVATQVGNAPPAAAWEDADLGPALTYCHPMIPGTGYPQDPDCDIGYEISRYYDCCSPMPDGPLVNYGAPVFNNVRMGVTHYGSHFTQEREFILRADYGVFPGDGSQRVDWKTLEFLTPGITAGNPHVLHADPVTTCAGNSSTCTYKIRPVDLANAVEFGAGDQPSWYFGRINTPVAFEGGSEGRFTYGTTLIALGMYLTENQTPVPAVVVDGDDGDEDLTYSLRGLVHDDAADQSQHHYYWDFGDGTTVDGYQKTNVIHTYATPGNYQVTLAVTDPDGAEGVATDRLGDRLQITEFTIPHPPTHVGDEFDADVTVRNGATRPLHCVNPSGLPDIRPATSFEVVSRPAPFQPNSLAPREEITFDFRFRVTNVLPPTLQWFPAVKAFASSASCPGTNGITLIEQLDIDLVSAPPPPTGVTASPGDGSADVTWTAPAGSVTGYTATATPGGASCSTSSLGCTITGLTNGTAYTVAVTTTNADGTGSPSAGVPVTPVGPPGAPTGVTGRPLDRAVQASWTAPASTGGSPITGYTATATPSGKTCSTTGATTCKIRGLRNGTADVIRVQAANAARTGAASDASPKITPRTVPGAPRTPGAKAASEAARITWAPPTSTGGAPITSYRAIAKPGGASCTAGATQRSCTIAKLVAGRSYSVTVQARNAAGWGNASDPTGPVVPKR